MDPIETDTARFWENHGEYNDVDTASDPDRGVHAAGDLLRRGGGHAHQLQPRPSSGSGRRPIRFGQSRTDIEILADLFLRIRKLYEEEGGTGAEPLMAIDWSYADPLQPSPDELLRELNGKALADLRDAEGKVDPQGRRAARQLRRDARRRLDRRLQWIYTGVYGPNGNLSQRRSNADPSGLGVYGSWGFAWPANRRIQYNRASADPQGKPWSEAEEVHVLGRRALDRSGRAGLTSPTIPPDRATGPFIMNAEGVSRLWVRGQMVDGPFPAHYEPFESPVANPLFPKVRGNPVARVFDGDMEIFGTAEEFPIVATTYRLTEHFHYWTKSVQINAVLQPEFFVEMSEQLAAEKGIRLGQMVRVWSNRGEVKGKGDGDQAAHPAHDRRQDGASGRAAAATSASSA